MNRFLIWGTGRAASSRFEMFVKMNAVAENRIIGFVDNDQEKWGKQFKGYNIYAPSDITSIALNKSE